MARGLRSIALWVGDALAAALLIALWLAAAETFDNAYLATGLHHLSLFRAADRLRTLLTPALLLAAAVAISAAVARSPRLRRRLSRLGLVLVVAAGAGVALAATRSGRGSADGPVLLGLLAICLALTLVRRRAQPGGLASALGRRVPFAAIVLALSLLAAAAANRAVRSRGADRFDVLVIVLDTVGARHLAHGGYARDTMPELEGMARRGILYERAYSTAPWTVPSHASIFTGLLPVRHGATQEDPLLERRLDTLAEILGNQGFRTFAAVGTPVVGRHSQFDQGFESFRPTWRERVHSSLGAGGRHPNSEALLQFLDALGDGQRFFAFLNYIEAHAPYLPPEPFDAYFLPPEIDPTLARDVQPRWPDHYTGRNPLSPSQIRVINDLYDGELAYLSRILQDLIDELERRNRLERTLVVITSDHGEHLGDHGHFDHVFSLYEALLRVPLVVFGGGSEAGAVVEAPVSLAQIFDTVLAAAGISWHGRPRPGADLRRPPEADPEGPVAEYYFPQQALAVIPPEDRESAGDLLSPYLRRIRSIRDGNWKLIWASDGRHELYHLGRDPDERRDLAAARPARVRELELLLEERLRAAHGGEFQLSGEPPPDRVPARAEPDAEAREQLRALGYLR